METEIIKSIEKEEISIIYNDYKFYAKTRFTYLKFVFIEMKILVSARLTEAQP